MKITKIAIPLLTLVLLASCGAKKESSSSAPASTPESTESQPSSEPAPTFEAYTLSQLHEARVAKSLASLDNKYVSVKGKVTFAKRTNDTYDILFIQNGKYAVEVSYPSPYSVNVGDAVEVKGQFRYDKMGVLDTIAISTYRDTNANFNISVINEAISTETVTITKKAELVEYEGSLAKIDFKVTSNDRTNAAFDGKLAGSGEEDPTFIVANKLGISDKFEGDGHPFEVNDDVRYEGVFTYSEAEDVKVIRYLDKEGFKKISE